MELEFMKDCLKEFSYPKIHSMDDLQVIDIFSKANRQFLVAWIFKNLVDDVSEILERATVEELANIIWCNGFCCITEKDSFMKGECEIKRQLEILFKLFKYLKSVSDSKKKENKDVFNEVDECLQFDTNLFPMYGAKQTLSPESRAKRIQDYRKEIEDIQNLLDVQNEEEEFVADLALRNQLVDVMTNVQLNFPDFKKQVLEIMKNGEQTKPDNIYNEDFARNIDLCSNNIQAVFEFIKDMNVVTNFKQNTEVVNVEYDNKTNAILRELAELCVEITAMKKENNF